MSKLSHLDEKGAARMVDVSDKNATDRSATAEAFIRMSPAAFDAVMEGKMPKGDVLAAARIAGIMAAKKTSDLIPLCHPLALTGSDIAFEPDTKTHTIRIAAAIRTTGKTGVEMEALVAASMAALTVYDMIKAIDKAAVVDNLRLVHKSGGKSGDFTADARSRPNARPQSTNQHKAAPKPSEIPMGTRHVRRSAGDAVNAREAFRTFMSKRRLRATQWAKDAGIPVSTIYSYLTGRVHTLPGETVEKLAQAAKVRAEDMFR